MYTSSTKQQNEIPKVRILVVGDSGVGKTSLIHRLCHHENLRNPRWTIGCGVDVMIYEYKQRSKNFFIEFWDVGGAKKYKSTRHLFYSQVNGIMFVYDVSNSKSYHNLRKWIREILNAHKQQSIEEKYIYTGDFLHLNGGNSSPHRRGVYSPGSTNDVNITYARSLGSLPVLVVGTKYDILDDRMMMQLNTNNPYNSMKDFGMESSYVTSFISLDKPLPQPSSSSSNASTTTATATTTSKIINSTSNATNDLERGHVVVVDKKTTPMVNLCHFFDQVIERRYYRTEKTLEKRFSNQSHVYARRDSLAHAIYANTTSHIRSQLYSTTSSSNSPTN